VTDPLSRVRAGLARDAEIARASWEFSKRSSDIGGNPFFPPVFQMPVTRRARPKDTTETGESAP